MGILWDGLFVYVADGWMGDRLELDEDEIDGSTVAAETEEAVHMLHDLEASLEAV